MHSLYLSLLELCYESCLTLIRSVYNYAHRLVPREWNRYVRGD